MNILEEYDSGNIPKNKEIFDSFLVVKNKLETYNNIVCSVSGGSDSDIMLDLFCKLNKEKVTFVFFDTGLEYKATKEHLRYLEQKYDIKIYEIRSKKPIPITCRDDGQPFISKQVSENIERLQRHKFKWKDKPFEELYKEYPKCKAALQWWTNTWGRKSNFNIERNKGLKEFLILNPPGFNISSKCCKYAKKEPIHKFIEENNFDLNCYGVRKSEGGQRSSAYKNCFSDNSEKEKIADYRPIFWYKDETKKIYENSFNVVHSKCYTEYGLKRTGCAGCPFGRDFETELKIIKQHEPNLYKAVNNIFRESYEYTRKYRAFVKENFKKENNKQLKGQTSMF